MVRTVVIALVVGALAGPASAELTWTQVGDHAMRCSGDEYMGDISGGEEVTTAGACLDLVKANSQKPDYAVWRGEAGGTRGCYACKLEDRGLGPDPSLWPFDEDIPGVVSMCGVDPSAPTPAPGGQTWAGNPLDTYTWAVNTKCSEGRGYDPVITTTRITRMNDGLSACVEQTDSDSGTQYYAKWTCSQSSPGGKLKSVKCASDSQCGTCDAVAADYDIDILPNGLGACLDQTNAAAGANVAYLMTPPPPDPVYGRPVYESAIPPCMVDSTPAPTPATPTPAPATTCAACVVQDNKQWCWPPADSFSRAVGGAADEGHCATPGGSDCSKPRSTCHMEEDCACNDCNDSEACGGPGPTPAPATTCDACIAQENKQWCFGVDGKQDGCYTPGGWECTFQRSVCKMTEDCACHDCSDADSCKNAPTPAPYPTECVACVASGFEWCQVTNQCGPKLATLCSYQRAVCDSNNDCQCQSCANTACQAPGPTPPPVPTPPTPITPTPPPTSCEMCMAEDKEWCWASNECITPGSGCTHDGCVYGEISKDLCHCSSCSDESCKPAAPTPSPATTCKECTALDNMEWCWDPAPTFATEVLGADPGYCLKPGDGCHQTRSTCKMTIDCDCQDCDDSVRCGAPNPNVWTGTAKTYEFPHATGCNPADRPTEPAWTVIKVSRMPTDSTSKCSTTKKTAGLGYLYIKETCQAPGTQFGSKSVKRTVCHNPECTSCDDDKGITYAMEFPVDAEASSVASDACMVATGFSHVTTMSYQMDVKSVVTDSDSASMQSANPTCFQPPAKPPTPAPTPAEWATCEGCIAGGVEANRQWCWGETDPATGKKGPAHCATPGGIDCSKPRSTCPMGIDCACSACDDSERCGGPKKGGSSSKAGIGVGLGLGIPAVAAGLFMFQKKRLNERAMSMGTANQALTGTGAGATSLEPADYAQL